MDKKPFFYNKYSEKIYEILEAYQIAYTFSRNKKIKIYVNFEETEFSFEKEAAHAWDAMMFTVKYHPNMKKNNIEIYHVNMDVVEKINKAGDLAQYITFNKKRAKLSRFGIKDAVIFLKDLDELQRFLSDIDKYF